MESLTWFTVCFVSFLANNFPSKWECVYIVLYITCIKVHTNNNYTQLELKKHLLSTQYCHVCIINNIWILHLGYIMTLLVVCVQ